MDVNTTLQTWINVLTHPGEPVFAEEQTKSQANFTTAIIWMVITGAVTGILGWLAFSLRWGSGSGMLAMIDQMNLPPEAAEQLRQAFSSGMMGAVVGSAGLSSIITTPLFFFIGAAIFYLIGRMLGGDGDLGRYAYLLASFQAPLGIITALLNLIPVLGGCVSALLGIYSLVLTYFATKVGLNLSGGKAIAVILIPVVLLFGIVLCFAASIAGLLFSLQNQ
jgi:hypothetical protein